MGFQFAGKAVYSAVWVAAVSLFMELLGFSTQKWLTAGGLGTVLLTLAGREVCPIIYVVHICFFLKIFGRFTKCLVGDVLPFQQFVCHLNHLLLFCSDFHKFSVKCYDSCNKAICGERVDSNQDRRL